MVLQVRRAQPSTFLSPAVIPAQTGIQGFCRKGLDSRFRWNDTILFLPTPQVLVPLDVRRGAADLDNIQSTIPIDVDDRTP